MLAGVWLLAGLAAGTGGCCPNASLVLTKFSQVDGPVSAGVVPVVGYRQRALEIHNPSCEAVALSDYMLVMVNPGPPMEQMQLPLGMRGSGGRGSQTQEQWLPVSLPGGHTLTLCNNEPTTCSAWGCSAEQLLARPLEEVTLLPRELVASAFSNCSGGDLRLDSTGAGGSILLVRTGPGTAALPTSGTVGVVDAIHRIPDSLDDFDAVECSMSMVRLAQYQSGNPTFNDTEWSRLYGSNCGRIRGSTVAVEDLVALANATIRKDGSGPGGCGAPDDLYAIFWDDKYQLGCEDWDYYDCTLARTDYTYSVRDQAMLLVECPHVCNLCATFGYHRVPNASDIGPGSSRGDIVGALCSPPLAVDLDHYLLDLQHASDPTHGSTPSPSPAETCCPGAFPIITMFAQLGAEGYHQRSIELFNPSCSLASFSEYELAFFPENCQDTSLATFVLPLRPKPGPFGTGDSILSGSPLVLCVDMLHPIMSEAEKLYNQQTTSMPEVLVQSAWKKCSSNMSDLPAIAYASVSLRRINDSNIVDTLNVQAPMLGGFLNLVSCSMAWVRTPGNYSNSPIFNPDQWHKVYGANCKGQTVSPPGDMLGLQLGFGERTAETAPYDQHACADGAAPVARTAGCTGGSDDTSINGCCRDGYAPLITKFLQLDVSWLYLLNPEISSYQQRAIEIYNPTCSALKLLNFELVFLDEEMQVRGKPLVAWRCRWPVDLTGGDGRLWARYL